MDTLETFVPEPPQRRPREDRKDEEDRSERRLLMLLLWFLGFAAVALLALLIWLLWPEGGAPAPEAGYPIEVVTTIYGYGEGPDELLRTPLGVAFDGQGHVWISNTGQSRVEQYTTDGSFVGVIGTDEPGKLFSPYGLAVDPDAGRVYVADYGAGLVQVYSTSGQYVAHFPADDEKLKTFGEAFSPYAVAVVEGRIVVSSNDGLYSFDTSGHVVRRWVGTENGHNVRGPDFERFNFPNAFAVDPDSGTTYVADTLNRRVVAINREGKWLWVSGSPDANGQITGFWELPRGLEVGSDGNVYVIDTFRPDGQGMGAGHFVVLSPDGELLSEFGRTGFADGAFSFPEQIAFDEQQQLWAIADRENNRVVIFRLREPYPAPTQIEAEKYAGALSNPLNAWSTPRSEREGSQPG